MESAEPDLKSSQVTVKGVFDPAKLVEYVHKRTGKQAEIVKQEPEKKDNKEEAKEGSKDEKKSGEEGDKDKKSGGEAAAEENKEKKGDGNEGSAAAAPAEGAAVTEETKVVEFLKRNEYNYYQQRYAMEPLYAYPPQIFSDENPNACSVM